MQRDTLMEGLTQLRLPGFKANFEELARQGGLENWGFEEYLSALVQQEIEEREVNRRLRFEKASGLMSGKQWSNFERGRLSSATRQKLSALRDGDFISRHENVLAFGNPGSGKSHLLSALGHELIQQGYRVLFSNCSLFVQDLLHAKAELKLTKHLRSLRKYDVVILDDLGYVQQTQEEMEVLFTFFSERYEQGSVMVSSNLPFSEWDKIFKNPMVAAATIDRLVHHSVILELNLPSYRMEQAQKKLKLD